MLSDQAKAARAAAGITGGAAGAAFGLSVNSAANANARAAATTVGGRIGAVGGLAGVRGVGGVGGAAADMAYMGAGGSATATATVSNNSATRGAVGAGTVPLFRSEDNSNHNIDGGVRVGGEESDVKIFMPSPRRRHELPGFRPGVTGLVLSSSSSNESSTDEAGKRRRRAAAANRNLSENNNDKNDDDSDSDSMGSLQYFRDRHQQLAKVAGASNRVSTGDSPSSSWDDEDHEEGGTGGGDNGYDSPHSLQMSNLSERSETIASTVRSRTAERQVLERELR